MESGNGDVWWAEVGVGTPSPGLIPTQGWEKTGLQSRTALRCLSNLTAISVMGPLVPALRGAVGSQGDDVTRRRCVNEAPACGEEAGPETCSQHTAGTRTGCLDDSSRALPPHGPPQGREREAHGCK